MTGVLIAMIGIVLLISVIGATCQAILNVTEHQKAYRH